MVLILVPGRFSFRKEGDAIPIIITDNNMMTAYGRNGFTLSMDEGDDKDNSFSNL